jgi:hypothetical protein
MSNKRITGSDAWHHITKDAYARWANRIERFDDELVIIHHEPKFRLGPSERFFCVGSCFARNVEEHLIYRGFDVLSKRVFAPAEEWPHRVNGFVNKFTTHSMRNELEWLINPPNYDSSYFSESEAGWLDLQLCPGVRPVSLERALERRRYLTNDYFQRLREATVVVVTLGLNEVWHDAATNRYLNAPPTFFAVRREPLRYTLQVTDVAQNVAELERVFEIVKALNKQARLVVTVSPVPMSETFSGRDVLLSNTLSKSTLRVAAEGFAARHDSVDYFPSYDMVTMSPRNQAYGTDRIHVADEIVGGIMEEFIRNYTGIESEPIAFNELAYLAANPDVEAAVRRAEFTSGFEHWKHHGKDEGRHLAPQTGPTEFMVAAGVR